MWVFLFVCFLLEEGIQNYKEVITVVNILASVPPGFVFVCIFHTLNDYKLNLHIIGRPLPSKLISNMIHLNRQIKF